MPNAAFAARLAGRIGRRWRHTTELAQLDDRLRRDIGLPARAACRPACVACRTGCD